jgi:hypothetical protein
MFNLSDSYPGREKDSLLICTTRRPQRVRLARRAVFGLGVRTPKRILESLIVVSYAQV